MDALWTIALAVTRLRDGEEPAAPIVFPVRRRAESAPGARWPGSSRRYQRAVAGSRARRAGESRRRIGAEQLAAADYRQLTSTSARARPRAPRTGVGLRRHEGLIACGRIVLDRAVRCCGERMSKQWLSARNRSWIRMRSWTTARSRPLTRQTQRRPARPRTASRILSEMRTASGRSTMGGQGPVVVEEHRRLGAVEGAGRTRLARAVRWAGPGCAKRGRFAQVSWVGRPLERRPAARAWAGPCRVASR
jgi:hypothetical protein